MKAVITSFLLLAVGVAFAQTRSAQNYLSKSHTAFNLKKYVEAELFADSARIIFQKSRDMDSLVKTFRWLAEIHFAAKEYQKGLMDAQAIALYKDSVDMQLFQANDEKWKSVVALEQEARRADEVRYASELKEHLTEDASEKRYNIILVVSLLSLGVLGVVAINRKRLEAKRELERARTELSQLSLFKEKLYTILSTSLVNSLSSFDMLTQRLSSQQKTFNQSENNQVLNELQTHTAALTTNLSSLLYWVGNQARLKPTLPEVLNCKMMIQQVIDRYRPVLEEKHLSTLVFIPDQQEVVGDKEMLRIVVDNLFSNAVRYSSAGGSITCFTGDKDELVMVGIKDTGTGISEEDCKKLFNQMEGVGLGLAVAKDLVEQNGGRIYVESTLGQGSTFYFTLPGKKIN